MPILEELTRRRARGPLELAGRALYRFGYGQEPPEQRGDMQDLIARELIKREIERRYPAEMTPYQKAQLELATRRQERRELPRPPRAPAGFQETAVVEGQVVPVRPYVPPKEEKIYDNKATSKYLKQVLAYKTQEEAFADLEKYRSSMELEKVDINRIKKEIMTTLPKRRRFW